MMMFNNGGTTSDIDGPGSGQFNTFYWDKKSLIEAKKEMYFTQLADVKSMPKHMGKTIKVYHYIPLLDDRNVNDQGIDAAGVTQAGPDGGRLYGSSKDTGTILSKLPTLTEVGGRVNRVGFTRIERQGSISKFGFFTEYTQESLDFDSDSELYGHMSREMVTGAVQLTEAVLQADLLGAAGVVAYPGDATSTATVTGEGADATIVDWDTLSRLSQTLDDNRTPKQTKIITGSRMIDTKTVSAGRVMYVGSELVPLLKKMVDSFGDRAFVPVHQYADAGTVMTGEIGTIDQFKIIVVPEMQHWAGAGAAVVTNPGYRETDDNYDVFPMLVVGDEAFTTIGFQTDGKTVKFDIIAKKPGKEQADRNDPYGEVGFASIKWYYGIMIMRPERIALIKTVAPL